MARRTRIRFITDSDEKSIAGVAQTITTQSPFLPCDFDDVKQELRVELFLRSHRFRSGKANWDTFRWKILAQAAGRIKRNRMQPSHQYMNPPTFSLDQPIGSDSQDSEDYPTLIECVSNKHMLADGNEPDGVEQIGLIIDVQTFVTSLPAKYRTICNAICDYGIKEAGKKLHIPKRTLSRRIAEIRRRMVLAGLDIYLGK